jgi:hypothetical protein
MRTPRTVSVYAGSAGGAHLGGVGFRLDGGSHA